MVVLLRIVAPFRREEKALLAVLAVPGHGHFQVRKPCLAEQDLAWGRIAVVEPRAEHGVGPVKALRLRILPEPEVELVDRCLDISCRNAFGGSFTDRFACRIKQFFRVFFGIGDSAEYHHEIRLRYAVGYVDLHVFGQAGAEHGALQRGFIRIGELLEHYAHGQHLIPVLPTPDYAAAGNDAFAVFITGIERHAPPCDDRLLHGDMRQV